MRAALLALLLLAVPASANDSTGFMATTGLELRRTPAIAMLSEELVIGPERIAVDYVFRNHTDQAVTTLVVFPLPDIDLSVYPDAANWNIPHRDVANFLDFTVTVAGQAVSPQLEQKAMVGARDVSAVLRDNGLDFTRYQWGDLAAEAIARLPAEARYALRRAGATTRKWDQDWPAWRLQTRYWWEQAFPPNQDLAVAHRYRPFAGQAALGGPAFRADGPMARHRGGEGPGADRRPATQRYCVDAGTAAAARRLTRRGPDSGFEAVEIEYILQTARNWSGRIGRFRLVLEKDSAETVMSLCWRGDLRRESPTRFVFETRNWLPDQDIRVAFLRQRAANP